MGSSASKGASKGGKITSRDRAILDLKVQRDRLKQYQKKIVVVLERETEIAREHVRAGHKDRALLALKKKKYQEQLLEKTNGQLLNLEQLTSSIEFALVEKQVFDGLKQGNSVLAEIQKEMSLEDVEKLMEETAEAIEYQEQISRALSGKITEEDEEDVLQELETLRAVVNTPLPPSGLILQLETPELPAVPTHEPVVVVEEAPVRRAMLAE